MTPSHTVTYTLIDSFVGKILIAQDVVGLRDVRFMAGKDFQPPEPDWRFVEHLQTDAVKQLGAYFRGELTAFDLPLSLQGTPFERDVWQALQGIPYGQTASYGDVAKRVGRPRAVRAVGQANGKNHIPVVIPCHRVIGSDGRLTGFGSGLEIKAALLEHERKNSPRRG